MSQRHSFLLCISFIFIFVFIPLFSSASAQTFIFKDGQGSVVTSGFSFTRQEVFGTADAAVSGNKFYFVQRLSLEGIKPCRYSFSSATYSIDRKANSTELLQILDGERLAPAYSVYVVYLAEGVKPPTAASEGASKAYSFGGPAAFGGPSSASAAERRFTGATAFGTGTPANNGAGGKPVTWTERTTQTGGVFGGSVTTPSTPYTGRTEGTIAGNTVNTRTTTTTATGTNSLNGTQNNYFGSGGRTYITSVPQTATRPVTPTPQISTTTPAVPGNSTTVTTPGGATTGSGKKKVYTLNLGQGGGSVSGIIRGGGGSPLSAESVIVTVSNASNTYTQSVIVQTDGAGTAFPFQITGIPPILQGSTDSYKLTVLSDAGYSVTANPISGIKLYGDGQNVFTQPITMQANRGRLSITLYHGPNTLAESDSQLLTLAQNAVMNIPGYAVSCRFTGESPRHFYRYEISDAPAGTWTLEIMFPGHSVSGQTKVWVPSNGSATRLFDLTER